MKKLLVVVDFQNDFVDGALGFENAKLLESRIVDKIKEYEKNNDEIIFTLDTHYDNYLETIEGQNLPIKHCIKGSCGHELYGEVKELAKNHLIFEKETFGSDKLYEHLKANKYSQIELVGLVSNICVISNAVLAKVAQKETSIVVDASCTDSNDPSLNDMALKVMESFHVKVINKNG